MKFRCEKALLVSAISLASRTVSAKSTIPCLEGILLRVDSEVLLTGFNLETGISVKVGAAVTEPGACVMPARLFFDIIRKLPDEEVTVEVDRNLQVSIRGGASSFQISAMDAEDYPDLPEVSGEEAVCLPQCAMAELIRGTLFSVSESPVRPVLTGCLFEISQEGITVVAVDSSRLARRSWHSEQPLNREMKFVIPAAALKEVEKILTDSDEDMRLYLDKKHLLFQIGDATLVCRLLDGDFIDWRRVVPVKNETILTARVSDLTASIERVSLIVSEKIKSPVRCVFGDGIADFKTVNTIGSAHDTCPIAGNGKELEIGFNCRFLLDALRAVPSEEVTLELQNGLSPIVFTPVDQKHDFAYMVLPVRLH